jgi:hypothetical protein
MTESSMGSAGGGSRMGSMAEPRSAPAVAPRQMPYGTAPHRDLPPLSNGPPPGVGWTSISMHSTPALRRRVGLFTQVAGISLAVVALFGIGQNSCIYYGGVNGTGGSGGGSGAGGAGGAGGGGDFCEEFGCGGFGGSGLTTTGIGGAGGVASGTLTGACGNTSQDGGI